MSAPRSDPRTETAERNPSAPDARSWWAPVVTRPLKRSAVHVEGTQRPAMLAPQGPNASTRTRPQTRRESSSSPEGAPRIRRLQFEEEGAVLRRSRRRRPVSRLSSSPRPAGASRRAGTQQASGTVEAAAPRAAAGVVARDETRRSSVECLAGSQQMHRHRMPWCRPRSSSG